MSTKTLKDLMIPLTEYAVVDEDDTLLNALKALDEAQKKLSKGQFLHRSILIKNKKGHIVGKMDHYAFLKAYLANENWNLDDPVLYRSGVSNDMLEVTKTTLKMFDDTIGDSPNVLRDRAHSAKVKTFMNKRCLFIDENASLLEAIKMIVNNQALSIMVTRDHGKEVEGIVRVSDVFDELTSDLREKGNSNDAK